MTSGIRRVWTPEEDQQIIAWRAEGVSYRDIAERLNSNGASIASHFYHIAEQAGAPPRQPSPSLPIPPPAAPDKPGARKCLCCSRTFASAHAGNRICWRCKQLAERVTVGCQA